MNKETHNYGEWIIDTPASETTKGNKHRNCSVCGFEEKVSIAKTEYTYSIISGADSVWEIVLKDNFVIKIDGEYKTSIDFEIDGNLVGKEKFTVEEGSTIITLKSEYFKTLPNGKHELIFMFEEKEVKTSFTIVEEKKEPESTSTTDKKDDSIVKKTGATNTTVSISFMSLMFGGYFLGKQLSKEKK